MSKGSNRRPGEIPDSAWDRIFKKPPEFPAVPAGQQPAVDSIGEPPIDRRKKEGEE